jgi:hypothetical protein
MLLIFKYNKLGGQNYYPLYNIPIYIPLDLLDRLERLIRIIIRYSYQVPMLLLLSLSLLLFAPFISY